MQSQQNGIRPYVKFDELKKNIEYYLVFEMVNGKADWVRGKYLFAEDGNLVFELNPRHFKHINAADYNLLEPTGTSSFVFDNIVEAFDYLDYLEDVLKTKPLTKESQ